MRIDQLKCFLEVARTGSISSAAQQLYISQQSASQIIKQLERELGCELLVRGKTGVGLTTYGVEVAKSASKILIEHDTLLHKLDNIKVSQIENTDNTFTLLSISSVINILLPHIISSFESHSKHIDVKLTVCDKIDEVFHQVLNDNYDIGLVTYDELELHRKIETNNHGIKLDILAKDEIVGVIDVKYYKGQSEYISLSELQRYRLTQYNIVPNTAFYDKNGLYGHVVHSNDAEFHRSMLDIGALVIMPKLAYEYFFKLKRFIALPVEDLNIPLVHAAIYKKDQNKYLKEFVAMIRREMHVK